MATIGYGPDVSRAEAERLDRIEHQLGVVAVLLKRILVRLSLTEVRTMSRLDDLAREVQESKTVTESAVTFISGIKAQLEELAENATTVEEYEEKLGALASDLESQQQTLAAAMVANTAAAGATGEAPPAVDPNAGDATSGTPV